MGCSLQRAAVLLGCLVLSSIFILQYRLDGAIIRTLGRSFHIGDLKLNGSRHEVDLNVTYQLFDKDIETTSVSHSTFSQQTSTEINLKPCVLNNSLLRTNVSPDARAELIARDTTFLQHVLPGGAYKPRDCKASGNVAVIVPYRDRKTQLPLFLRHMHHFLQTQKTAYAIFVIEMTKGLPFNRGMLMNIGFELATGTNNFTCFVFHDVDLLPTNEANLYDCANKIRHLATGNSKNKYKVPYPTYFGGVVSFNEQQFRDINGFSNLYFGWGTEDDDLLIRVNHKRLGFERVNTEVGRYEALNHSLPHFDEKPIANRKDLVGTSRLRRTSEGLNSLMYKQLNFELRDLYTWALVDFNKTELHSRYMECKKRGWPCDFKNVNVTEIYGEATVNHTKPINVTLSEANGTRVSQSQSVGNQSSTSP